MNKTASGAGSQARDHRRSAASAATSQSGAAQSGVAPPRISLPKGGGALRGMGEKFDINPVTGTGAMSVPIFTSPGRNGFGPELSLSYDSGAGNGAFGLGWSLSLAAITRKTDKGLPQYCDAQQSDVYLLSGAEDLVPALKLVAGEWVPDEMDQHINGNHYTVRRYRPRVEGLFARIERWTHQQTGQIHWRSITKENVTAVYGSRAEARISDPDDPLRVFSWLICESYDDKGNAVLYEYKAEDTAGVDRSLPHENNRLALGAGLANRYIKRIRYGNRTPRSAGEDLTLRTDWLFDVVFDYGEHDADTPTPAEATTWPVRPDPLSNYRAAFEIRTYRLCRRVLMFHHFAAQLGTADYLVRSTDLTYHQNPVATAMSSIEEVGYVRREDGSYLRRSMPPVEFQYSQAVIDETVHTLASESLANLPVGLDGNQYQWADLDGEGISGILTDHAQAWYYKRNLGGGRFAPLEVVARKPSTSEAHPQTQLLDLEGDGRLNLVQLDRFAPGYYQRTSDGWASFATFKSLPNRDWTDPNQRFVDLTGDGHSDVLITEDEVLTWYSSRAADGFGGPRFESMASDELLGPRLVFADGTDSIHLADMCGDGLSDLVRIRNGQICYWPNLGYGRFGAKVTMDRAPRMDHDSSFDPARIRLVDIDGSGTTDLIYLRRDRVDVYFNQSGNAWSPVRSLSHFPEVDNVAAVTTVDLLGNGTACLVWSSPLPSDAGRHIQYIDLMGGQKPHLMVMTKNNLGAETHVSYTSSTQFYLKDKAAGKPWVTRLPFPVQVIQRVDTYDRISRSRFVTKYAYHHGYFDGIEREFRGFGMVEHWDTEEFAALADSDDFPSSDNIDQSSHVPPSLTKTWYHTGSYFERQGISQQFSNEYYREPGLSEAEQRALRLPDTILPAGLDADQQREACRALKGSILRQEVYGLDGTTKSAHPYQVSERNSTIQRLQPTGANRHAVFFVHPRETLDYHYERNPADPRVTHEVLLEVDSFGNPRKAASVGYGRRQADPELTASQRVKQTQTLATYTENDFTNAIDTGDTYHSPLPCETRTYELTGITLPAGAVRFSFQQLATDAAAAAIIGYEIQPSVGVLQKRIVERVRTLYRKNDLSGALPLGQLQSLALPFESYQLALTPGLVADVFGPRVTDAILTTGGYVHFDGDANHWLPSGQVFYSKNSADTAAQELVFARQHFYLPHRFRDPLGESTFVTYDDFDLSPQQTTDAVGNEVTATIDYRVLQPHGVTDPNGNRAAVAFDALGMVVGVAAMGKEGQNAGDSLVGFNPNLDAATITNHLQNPLLNPHAILGKATTRIVYDLQRYRNTSHTPNPLPNVVYTLQRETHDADLAVGVLPVVQHAMTYSDGFGRVVQEKQQAEPGEVDGAPTDPRWTGSGWTVFNNKGDPVKQYEPFFTATHEFEYARMVGVGSTQFYDSLGRLVGTLYPNHTYDKLVFDPWRQVTWDVSDTVLEADPRLDADLGPHFRRIPANQFSPSWHANRVGGALGAEEQSAATKTQAHANTPRVEHFDTLGRPFLTIDDNGAGGKYSTLVHLDIEGNQREVVDSHNRVVMRYRHDMLGNNVRQDSMEAGTRWTLGNVAGNAIYGWDSRDHRVRHVHDGAQRLTHRYVKTGAAAEQLVERTVYGEAHPGALNLNLRGQAFLLLDRAGVVTNDQFDFKGNLLQGTRRLAKEFRQVVSWLPIEPVLNAAPLDLAALDAALAPHIESTRWTSSTQYDALNRPTAMTTPDQTVIRPQYNEANLLERIQGNVRGAAALTTFVHNINYDAKGQRLSIRYGNQVETTYEYDPRTFRPTRIHSTRDNTFPAGQRNVQDLRYVYDAVGNVTSIRDQAQQTIYFNNNVVEPHTEYTYDAIYRLVEARGREHRGQAGTPQSTWNDMGRVNLAHPHNGHAMQRYTEQYQYDQVGNIEQLVHLATHGNWTRDYVYNESSLLEPARQNNRLTRTQVGAIAEPYTHDAHGNITRMLHLPTMQWDFEDQMQQAELLDGRKVFYLYDSDGERTRKVVVRPDGSRREEWIYLGTLELYRTYQADGETIQLERQTLHVRDDETRVALIETRTQGHDDSPAQLIRCQLGNHLDSVHLELSEIGELVSYEEYTPYGSTSYQAPRSQTKVPKRYRYTDKERDTETGLYYHGARYYAPWVGRWTSIDPALFETEDNDGQESQSYGSPMQVRWGSYTYAANNPVVYSDDDGNNPAKKFAQKALTRTARKTLGTLGAGKTVKAARGAATFGLGRFIGTSVQRKITRKHVRGRLLDGEVAHQLGVFSAAYRTPAALQNLFKEVVTKGRASLAIHRGKLRWVFELEKKGVGTVTEGGTTRSAKYVRYVTDLAGNPVTGYPTKKLWDVRKVRGFNVVAKVSGIAAVVAFTSAISREAKAGHSAGVSARKRFSAGSYDDSILSWVNPFIILDILLTPSSSNRPLPEYRDMVAAGDRAVADLKKTGVQLTKEEAAAVHRQASNAYAEGFSAGEQGLEEPGKAKPTPRYLRSPDGMVIDTKTGRTFLGPGPKF